MADDQVKYSELILDDNNAFELLTKALENVKTKLAEVKAEAVNLQSSMKSVGTATREQQQAMSAHAVAAENLRKKMDDLTDEERKLEALRRRYKKLTDDEIRSVESLSLAWNAYVDSIKRGNTVTLQGVEDIDIQNKSYNELYQTYNALKDALNRMTTAERENTQAGKYMVEQAKRIRDTLNNLQQQTGNYTLNVGNYMSALNGLQQQTQQVLREIPSAQNLTQFFLAISNNIPMFADALARYNKGLPEIRAKLAAVTAEIAKQEAVMAGMNTQSAEYAAKQVQINELRRQEQQLQSVSVGGWRAILKSVGSWQTLLIAGLLLLRKIPDIIKWIKERWDRWVNGVKEMRNEVDGLTASIRLQADAIKKYASTAAQLDLIISKMSEINQESDQWAVGVRMINDLIGESKAKATDNLETLKEITDEYKKQAKQIAINNVLGEMYEQNIRNEMLRSEGYNIYGKYVKQGKGIDEMADAAAQILGIAMDSKEHKELKQLYQDQANAIYDYNKAIKGNYDEVRKTQLRSVRNAAGQMNMNLVEESDEEVSKRVVKAKRDAEQAITNFFNKRLEIYSEDELNKLAREKFELVDPLKKRKDKKGSTYNAKDVDFLESELLDKDAVIELESSYQRRLAMLKEAQLKERLILKEKYEQEQKDLKFNREKGLITEKEYDEQLAKLNKHYDDLTKTNYEGNFEEMGVIQRKYWNKRNELAAKEAERQEKEEERRNAAARKAVKEEEENFKKFQEMKKREFELTAHTATEEKKFVMEQQMELLQWRMDHAEALGISPEMLEVMEQEYKQMKKMYDLGKYSTGKQNVKGNYTSVMDMLFPDMDNDQKGALNSVFDQAKEALNGWMDARKAAAEQAKELADDEVSAAENALNREIELRNQGYANDVALKERELADAKKRQKEAADMQKKAEKDALAVNSAMEASSMAVAIANLFKDFPLYAAIPLTAVLLGSFAAAKVQSFQAIKTTKYKEGGVMLLEGGSHESGHDVNLGIGPDGSNLRAEGHEYFAVFNKPSSSKYHKEIPAVVNAFNRGVFEDKYIKTSDAVGLAAMAGAASGYGNVVDLSAVEGGVGQLVKQGERSWSVEGGYRVMRYKNLTRRVKISG